LPSPTQLLEQAIAAFAADGDPSALTSAEAQQAAHALASGPMTPQEAELVLVTFGLPLIQLSVNQASPGELDAIAAALLVFDQSLARYLEPSDLGRIADRLDMAATTFRNGLEDDEAEPVVWAALARWWGALAAALPPDYPKMTVFLANLGLTLERVFHLTHDRDALERAVDAQRRTLAVTPQEKPIWVASASRCGLNHLRLYDLTSDLAAIEQAVALCREAVGLTPNSDPGKPDYVGNLAVALFALWETTGDRAALDEAIASWELALELAPEDFLARDRYEDYLATAKAARP
jgi:tetratricopeptide (TPR) repeat protein